MKFLSTYKDAKVLVTGHTGFKGSWLTKWLLSMGAKVYGVSIDIPSKPSHFTAINLDSFIEDYRLDISDQPKVQKLISKIKPDFIFHLAAQAIVSDSYSNPFKTWQTNTVGTISILESIRLTNYGCIIILITSDKCYENIENIWGYKETDRLGGIDPYSASKAAAEIAISSYIKSFFPKTGKIRISSARAGNVIGGGDWANNRIVPDVIRAWSKNKAISLRNPNSTRPWQHVLEPLSGYLSLGVHLNQNNKLHGEAFNFGPQTDQNESVEKLVKTMSLHWKDRALITKQSSVNFHESQLLKLNCEKAAYYLRWKPVWDFDTTVKTTVNWYKFFYHKDKSLIYKITEKQIADFIENAKTKGLLWAK